MNSNNFSSRLRSLWRQYLESTMALNFECNENPRFVTYLDPGLHYLYDYNRYGIPDLVRVMIYTVSAESFANRYPCLPEDGELATFMYWDKLMQDRTSFVASTEYTFSRTFYNDSVPKWPLTVKHSFGGAGKTSLLTRALFFTANSQEPVITRIAKIVSVDRKTRRPLALPDWYREKLKGKEEKMPDFQFTGFKKALQTFVRRVQIVFSYTDANNHTNFSSYVQFGLDTLHLAMLQKSQTSHVDGNLRGPDHKLFNTSQEAPKTSAGVVSCSCESSCPVSAVPWMTEDIVRNGVRNLKICYMKESLEGGIIDVHIWQEAGEEMKVKCSVETLEGIILCQFILEYFPPSSSL
ncbi:hypothetical protein Btru_045329 [Bulinus truncatus]|nr:hypothetical protein Btru_045329 [Bulinus truncatus]